MSGDVVERQVSYGTWASSYGKRVATFDEAKARRVFDAMGKLDVMFGDPDAPDVVLSIGNDRMGVRVCFLDEFQRIVTEHYFTAPREDSGKRMVFHLPEAGVGKMFFSLYGHSTFTEVKRLPEDSDADVLQLEFEADGRVRGIRIVDGERSEGEGVVPEEMRESVLWQVFPRFGEWDDMIRADRDLPMVPGLPI